MGRKISNSIVCSLAVAFSALSTAQAETLSLEPIRDSTLYMHAAGARSNGAGPFMFAGRNSQSKTRRALLAFDIAGNIPAGATIVSASLTLTTKSNSSGATNIALHRVSSGWGEGTSDAGVPGGGGTSSSPGDATWVHTFFDSNMWGAPGGDFDSTSSAAVPVVGVGPVTWGTTLTLVANVQSWLDAPTGNHGWILVGDESAPSTATRYATRENSAPNERPRLSVEFIAGSEAVPTVSHWGLVIMLALLLTYARIVFSKPQVRRKFD